ncbi:MAG: hypothetical protein IJE97_02235, partial [Thermoguttaceae bacterium]|nr:hypothetical protein [Thermoguttaceae bacterium]
MENRELLALTVGSADFNALADSFVADETDDAAIWVTTLADSSSPTDGQITLREALDYAGTKINGQTLSSTIRFSLGGTIELSKTLTINKDVTVDASDVGGVVVDRGGKGQVLLLHGGKESAEVSVSLVGLTLTGGVANPTANGGAYKGVGVNVGGFCNLTATNCAVVGNSSSAALGVGIYVQGGRLTLIDSTVSGNSTGGATSAGGGIYVDDGDLKLVRTTVESNAAATGGGVYLQGGSAVLDGAFLVGNLATNGSGGGLYNFAGYLDVENASFLGNAATNFGGGLYNVGVEGRETLVVDATFAENSAQNGGAIYDYGGALSLTDSRFAGNGAAEAGGAIYVDANAELRLVDADFLNNDAEEIGGGAVFNAGVLAVDGARFDGDSTDGDGGSVLSTGYFEIRDAAFVGASATNGGAVAVDNESTGSISWILASTFENCNATIGGALSLGGSLSGAELRFADCSASSGGGAVSNAGTLVLSGADFDACVAASDGGALLNWTGASLTLADATVANAVSIGESGGGLANYGAATLSGVSFVGCEAALFGGAVVNGGTLAVRDSLFVENSAKNGGALSNASSGVATSENSTFWANRAGQNGGAAHCVGKTTFKNAYIARNVASSASSAATYRNPASEYEPTFDAKSTLVDNVAAANASTPTFADSILFFDAETNAPLDGAPLNFGDVAVNGAETTRTVAILNAGAETVAFSRLALSGVDVATLLYAFRRADGSTVDPNAFQLAPGETVYATLTVDPTKIGAKYFAFDWTAQTVANGSGALGPAETARLSASVQVEKQTSANVSGVSSLELSVATEETFNFALKTKPTSNVVVYLAAPDGVLLSTDVLVFTPANYNVAQSVGVSLDEAFFTDGGSFGASVVVEPKILSSETAFVGATVADVSLSVGARLTFVGDSVVDLSAVVGAAGSTTVWDLNGDGSFETRTNNGTPVWISSADVATTAGVVAFQTIDADGKRKTGRAEVVRVDAAPVVSAETTVFSALPGVVRLSLTSPDAAITRWRVNWGDGRPADVLNETATSAVFGHVYDADGEYDVRAELLDANGRGTGVWSFVGTVVVSGLGTSSAVFA